MLYVAAESCLNHAQARKTFLSLNAVEKAKQAGGVSLLDSVLEFRKIAGSGTVRRDAGDFAVKNEAGRREEKSVAREEARGGDERHRREGRERGGEEEEARLTSK